MGQTRRLGSAIYYVLVAGVLGAILLGSIYFVRHQTVAQDHTETAALDDNKKAESGTDEGEKGGASKVVELPGDVQSTATNLPETGPNESVGPLLGIITLTGFTVAYVRSRRAVPGTLT